MSYQHLSLEERYYIEIALKEGTSINQTAKALGRPQGTISKEIESNHLSPNRQISITPALLAMQFYLFF